MLLQEALQHAQSLGLERLDVQMLMLHAQQRSLHDRAWLALHASDYLNASALKAFEHFVQQRLSGEPIGYIVGQKEFYGLTLKVDSRVLIPRPDTETLVDWTLQVLHDHKGAKVLDLGTGSGAIALALKSVRPDLQVHALDFSVNALALAKTNATELGLDIHFSQGCWLENCTEKFDVIVSNPPYIEDNDPHLAALKHEPIQALTSGGDGLDDIRTIIRQAPWHLKKGGWLLLEHGYNQAPAVCKLLQHTGFECVKSHKDLAGIERCSGGNWPAVDQRIT